MEDIKRKSCVKFIRLHKMNKKKTFYTCMATAAEATLTTMPERYY